VWIHGSDTGGEYHGITFPRGFAVVKPDSEHKTTAAWLHLDALHLFREAVTQKYGSSLFTGRRIVSRINAQTGRNWPAALIAALKFLLADHAPRVLIIESKADLNETVIICWLRHPPHDHDSTRKDRFFGC
jgi:hypothetical protein